MAYRVRLFDRLDQQISFQDLDSPAEAGRWAGQAWQTLLSERTGPAAEREPSEMRHELVFVEPDGDERPATEDERREFSEALARD